MSGLFFLLLRPKMTTVAPLSVQKHSYRSVTPSQKMIIYCGRGPSGHAAGWQSGNTPHSRDSDVPIPLASSRYYNWAVAAPMVLSLQAFQRNLPEVSGTTHLLAMLPSGA